MISDHLDILVHCNINTAKNKKARKISELYFFKLTFVLMILFGRPF